MTKYIFIFLITLIVSNSYAEELNTPSKKQWKLLIGNTSLFSLLQPLNENPDFKRYSEIVSTDSIIDKNGRPALVVYVKLTQQHKSLFNDTLSEFFYRCIDYLNTDFTQNSFACYELRDPNEL